ncbi:MAG: hypothetical protein WD963_02555 [Candidatus Paceibacterota bacterium]
MYKVRILFILGVWVAVLPYLGFPNSWKNALFTITGLGLIFFSYTLHMGLKTNKSQKETFDNFSENKFEEGEEQN